VVHVVAFARSTGEALAARGLVDPPDDGHDALDAQDADDGAAERDG
jgi:biotin transport system permease protein